DISGVRLYAAGAHNGEPWAVVPTVQADVSLLDLARGQAEPRRITLSNAEVTLHFDQAGNLLTEIPHGKSTGAAWPEVVLDGGQLTLHQDGRPEMVIHGIQATLRPEANRLVLDGTIHDPYWKDWTLAGSADRQTWAVQTELKSHDAIHITQEMLNRLPLVSPSVWREVQVEGDTPVDFTVSVPPKGQGSHYRVAMQPHGTTVHVASLDLTAHEAHGGLVVDNGIVELKDVRGQVADGTLAVSGKLDFLSTPNQLHFDVQANSLNVSTLPPSWLKKLPTGVAGRLSGSANLLVTIGPDGTHTSGTGSAIIREARVAGLPAEPIHLRLTSDGGHSYRFVSQLPTPPVPAAQPTRLVGTDAREQRGLSPFSGGTVPVVPARAAFVMVALQNPPQSPALSWPGWLIEQTLDGIQLTVGAVENASQRVLSTLQTVFPRTGMPGAPAQALQINLAMNQIRLEALLHNLNISLPFPLTGRLSFRVRVAFPVDNPGNVRAYRIEGSASLPSVRVDDMSMRRVELRLLYADGVLHLEELQGTLAAPGPSNPGSFAGKADVSLFPTGDVSAELTLKSLPLPRVMSLIPGGPAHTGGTVSGSARLRVPLAKLRDFTAWHATGTVSAKQLVAYGWTVQDVQFDWDTQRNEIRISRMRGNLYQGTVRGTASLPLVAHAPGRLNLDFQDVDVGTLEKALPSVPVPLQGRASGTIQATLLEAKPAQPRAVSARLDLKSTQLRVQGIPTSRLTGTVDYTAGKARYRLEGHALGGTFTLDGQVPSAPTRPQPETHQSRFDLRGGQLGQLWAVYSALHVLRPLRGSFDLALGFDVPGPQATPAGSGSVVFHGLRWAGQPLAETLQTNVILDDGELRLANLGGSVAQGVLRGTVAINVYNADRSWFNVALDNGQAAALLAPWPTLARHVEGSLTVRLRGRLGRTSSGTGEVDLANAHAWGLDVTQWRLPLRWFVAASVGRGRVTIQDSTAQLAHGRLTGHAQLGWGVGSQLTGRFQFFELDVQSILRDMDPFGPSGGGLLTGTLALDGTDVRSSDDVTALLEARLTNAQAFQYPVLRQIGPYLGGESTASVGNGNIRARLAHNIVRVERLALTVRQLPLYIQGTMTSSGRLDLDVTVNRRRGGNPLLAGLLGSGNGQPLPLSLLSQATRLVAGQLVHLRVTGTLANPITQVEPPPILSDNALRFLLGGGR
ncbi:MAG TPA: hypothetical protein VFA18_22335, partial [Gemmataceae bacterium]|nr:hypothetical protein [Gemmataceae bacterium]